MAERVQPTGEPRERDPFDFRGTESVCGVKPREAMTLKVTEGTHGWYCAAHTGDGSKPGSLVSAAGSFPTAEAAFAYLLEHALDG